MKWLLAVSIALVLLQVAQALEDDVEIPKDVAESNSAQVTGDRDGDFLDADDDKYLNIDDELEAFDEGDSMETGSNSEGDDGDDDFVDDDDDFDGDDFVDDDDEDYLDDDDVEFAENDDEETEENKSEEQVDDEEQAPSKTEETAENDDDELSSTKKENEEFVEADDMPAKKANLVEGKDAKPKDEEFMGIWDETAATLGGDDDESAEERRVNRLGTQTLVQILGVVLLAVVVCGSLCGARRVVRHIRLRYQRKITTFRPKKEKCNACGGPNPSVDGGDDDTDGLLKKLMGVFASPNTGATSVTHGVTHIQTTNTSPFGSKTTTNTMFHPPQVINAGLTIPTGCASCGINLPQDYVQVSPVMEARILGGLV